MKKVILIKIAVVSLVMLFSLGLTAQIKQVSVRAAADVTLLKDKPNTNLGADWSNELCNYDSIGAYGGTDSPEESWIKWNLSEIESQIGEGEQILYAEVSLLITWNSDDPDIAQGYRALHMADKFDSWQEGNGNSDTPDNMGGITWTSALQIGDFENPASYSTIFEKEHAGVVPDFENFEVTDAVNDELNNGNKILTVRMVPYYYYNEVDRKKWLGFLTLQSNEAPGWGGNLPLDEEGYPKYAPHLIVYIGKPQYIFSSIPELGDIDNYSLKPDAFGNWMVVDDEGDQRLAILQKTPVDTNTWVPGATAIFKDSVYQDFDISVDAKMNYVTPSGAFFPFNDFIIIFGYQDADNFSYFAFYGNNESGTFKITNGMRSRIGDSNPMPAMSDTAYHAYRITRSGSKVTVYIDNNQYYTITDDALGTSGKIGLGSHNDVVYFDNFTDGRPSGIRNRKLFDVSLYPNPVKNVFVVQTEKPMESIQVFDLAGKTIISKRSLNSTRTTLDISRFPQGVYFVATTVNNQIRTDKIVKQ